MRRYVGVILVTALGLALLPSIARATPAGSIAAANYDLRPQLMMRVFGETTDSSASFSAAYGDRSSESPLRELALAPAPARPVAAFTAAPDSPNFSGARVAQSPAPDAVYDFAQAIRNRLLASNVRFAPPALTPIDVKTGTMQDDIRVNSSASYAVGQYRPVAPVPLISPQPGAFAFGPLARGSAGLPEAPPPAFAAVNAMPGTSGSTVVVPSTLHVGPVAFQTRVEGAALQAPQLALHDNAYGAGANFDVRAGRRNLNVDVSTGYERLTRNDATAFSTSAVGSSAAWQLPGANVPIVIPNFADMSKLSVGAAVAVPVVNGLTLNFNYAAARMYGGYGLPGLTNLDAINNSYGGRLTFAIPHSTGTLSISAIQSHYQDNILPANTSTQMREDVNFTVKF